MPARVLTIAGKTGPTTRPEMLEVVRFFGEVYGVPPRTMTVMPEWLGGELAKGLRTGGEDQLLATGDAVPCYGLSLSLGTQYTVTD